MSFFLNQLNRFKWQIYLRCRAGGIYPNDHLSGNIREFTYFLRVESGYIDLDRHYTWVKCNNDFRGYYVLDYSAQLFAVFDEILSRNKEVMFIYLYFAFIFNFVKTMLFLMTWIRNCLPRFSPKLTELILSIAHSLWPILVPNRIKRSLLSVCIWNWMKRTIFRGERLSIISQRSALS